MTNIHTSTFHDPQAVASDAAAILAHKARLARIAAFRARPEVRAARAAVERETAQRAKAWPLFRVRDDLAPLGLTVSRRDGEFRVAWPGDPASAYFTTDGEDAVNTGYAMARERNAG